MPVWCINCGMKNKDPGGDLAKYRCGECGGNLVRIPRYKSKVGKSEIIIWVAGVAATISAAFVGVLGLVLGALIGALWSIRMGRKT